MSVHECWVTGHGGVGGGGWGLFLGQTGPLESFLHWNQNLVFKAMVWSQSRTTPCIKPAVSDRFWLGWYGDFLILCTDFNFESLGWDRWNSISNPSSGWFCERCTQAHNSDCFAVSGDISCLVDLQTHQVETFLKEMYNDMMQDGLWQGNALLTLQIITSLPSSALSHWDFVCWGRGGRVCVCVSRCMCVCVWVCIWMCV